MDGMNKLLCGIGSVIFLFGMGGASAQVQADWSAVDSVQVRAIHDEILNHGECYENLRVLCKDIGHRLSGSEGAERAIDWGLQVLSRAESGGDTAWLQPVMVPHWSRGPRELAWMRIGDGVRQPMRVAALGGSVGTDGPMEAEVVMVKKFEALDTLGREQIEGRIVLFNRAMDPLLINTGAAYGGAYNQRSRGAVEAANRGGVAALVRSLTHALDSFPHTGGMRYDEDASLRRVPAAAVSTVDAQKISDALKLGERVWVGLNMGCELFADVEQANVIAQWRGSEFPDRYIVVGGHLDSWDIGEGAHDDGAGIVQSIEVMRALRATGYQPRHTLRVVLFINEENGNNGGKTYARRAAEDGLLHVAAVESDAGGGVPRGYSLDAGDAPVARIRSWSDGLDPYGLLSFRRGGAGVDIGPLKQEMPAGHRPVLVGLRPDSQRYFDYHHSDRDVFETIHKRELELGAAALASMVYLLDRTDWSPEIEFNKQEE
jgi:hypothetical protein